MDHATNHCHGHRASLLVLLYLVDARGHLPPAPVPRNIILDQHSLVGYYGSNLPGLIT